MCAFVYRNLSAFFSDEYHCARICVATYCSLIRTNIIGQPVIDQLIITQSPCSEVQLDPLLNTRLKHVVVYVRTELPPVFNYPQLWLASAIPRNLLNDHTRPQQRRQQAQQHQQQQQQQQQHPQPQQQQHPSHLDFASFIEPPPSYEDVTPRIEDVTDDDDDDNDNVIEISDAEEEREAEAVNSGNEAEGED